MNVAVVQMDVVWEDKPANFRKAHKLIQAAAPPPGTLVALPEMFATGFSLEAARLAEPAAGPTFEFLAKVAREFQITLIAGLAIRTTEGRFENHALVVGPDGSHVAEYAKMRPFRVGGEDSAYSAGTQPISFTLQDTVIAPFVCFDLRFPEIFRQIARETAPSLYVVIASWPSPRRHHWLRLLQARAIENQAYVVGVNRIGRDPQHEYSGDSVVFDYHGEPLLEVKDRELCAAVSLDLNALAQYRRDLPFLADLR
ncbi:MAG TPA: nitrilase-related carbon-nitrogen hydrolase [Verrucomicrobiota bacterium]|nr:amidohydrolase [Verrucomicrobiales bacterium]HRI12989.1 nitrilase-related carbon-nitrogen hydrolase [Verrucomicrobiota bacterium]